MIVADASWVIALRDPDDTHHTAARHVSESSREEDVVLNPVTFAECLVAPARLGVADQAAAALRAAFRISSLDDDAPIRWAQLRAATGLRLPDAIVLDTATLHGARAIATFDAGLADAARRAGLSVLC